MKGMKCSSNPDKANIFSFEVYKYAKQLQWPVNIHISHFYPNSKSDLKIMT